ncbi:MAG: histidinol-phosphate transaminase [Acidobacteria bacterium]|nr:histidinol-phosphate transaminase [Acidobacteriota bacterium]
MKTNDPLSGVKSRVLKVPAYSLHAYEAEIKLNQNENPFDFPADLKEEVFRRFRVREWSRYPDFVPDSVRKLLADFAGWRKDGVLVGNGSNELLQAALMVLVDNGTKVGIPAPTFTVYGLIASILGAEIIPIPLDPDMRYNVDEILSGSAGAGAGVLILNTPNNPTGSVISNDDLKRVLEEFPGHVLLDEAYFEFWGHTALELLEEYPRLIITRTFSKAMGMAGLRVGYLLADEALVSEISKAKLPYNVNQFSLTAAEVAVENRERFRPAIEAVLKERGRLGRELGGIPGIKVYPSEANFFLIEVPVDPRLLFGDLYRQGILIRDVSSYPMLSKCLRISVGTRGENDRLLSALRAAVGRRMPGGPEGARESI